uniref:Major histocompatibility complex class I-related gene protein-like n=1 Tax=Geotrypetes seraphini TaxID=260995 RepID=A0A6P8P7Y9_GEOSA
MAVGNSRRNHSLRYLTTIIKDAEPSALYFFAAVYLNDIIVEWYDSHTEVLEPRTAWVRKAVSPYNWRIKNQYLLLLQRNSMNVMKQIMLLTNQTEGVHTYQTMEGCELTDTNTTFVFYRTAFDRADFMHINTDTMNWTTEMPEAERIVQYRNANKTLTQWFVKGLRTLCDELRFLLPFANQTLQRKDKPNVRITERKLLNDSVTLYCHAYGFYPRCVEMKWLKNGAETQVKLEAEAILPNPDGTYQAAVSLNVKSNTRDDYACLVWHRSLEEDETVHW